MALIMESQTFSDLNPVAVSELGLELQEKLRTDHTLLVPASRRLGRYVEPWLSSNVNSFGQNEVLPIKDSSICETINRSENRRQLLLGITATHQHIEAAALHGNDYTLTSERILSVPKSRFAIAAPLGNRYDSLMKKLEKGEPVVIFSEYPANAKMQCADYNIDARIESVPRSTGEQWLNLFTGGDGVAIITETGTTAKNAKLQLCRELGGIDLCIVDNASYCSD